MIFMSFLTKFWVFSGKILTLFGRFSLFLKFMIEVHLLAINV